MKKVLILAYDFPPYVSVGGLRPYSWYKYMGEFDVQPVIITRQWNNKHGNNLDYISSSESSVNLIEETSNGIIIRAPYFPNFANRLMLKFGESKYRFLRKAVSAYYEFAQFIFFIGPKVTLYKAAKEYLNNNKVDLIIATGDPYILFKYASILSRKNNIPWIADYRDPWSHKKEIENNFILKKWHRYHEKKIVKTSFLITTVSDFFKIKIAELFSNKNIVVLPNGYDPDTIVKIKDIKQQSEVLKIAYVGYIYEWHPIRSFLNVITTFLNENTGAKIEVNFYGINIPEQLDNIISNDFTSIKNIVKIHPKIPNIILMEKLAKENVMLLFNYYSFPGTKIYDYIALKRTILFCYTDDKEGNDLKSKYYPYTISDSNSEKQQENLIKETSSGVIIKDSIQLLEELKKIYFEFSSTGEVKCNTLGVEKFSRKNQVKLFTDIIKNCSVKK